MAEKTEVMAEVIANPSFRNRIRATSAKKAYTILDATTPDAQELAWAKLVVIDGYEAWTEALLVLAKVQPATADAAYAATDTTYDAELNSVLPEVILAKGL